MLNAQNFAQDQGWMLMLKSKVETLELISRLKHKA